MRRGVPEDEVVEQYLLSNRAAQEIIDRNRVPGREHWSSGVLAPLIGVRAEYIQASFEAVQQEWGDFDGYLRDGLRITNAEREAIRAHLLE